MVRNRIVICLIVILYFIGIHKYSVSCAKSDSLYKISSARALRETGSRVNSKKLPLQYRVGRGVSGRNRHLRVDDAHQVANYFLKGGPAKGHEHFAQHRNCDSDSNGDNIVGESKPISEDNTGSPADKNNLLTDNPVARMLQSFEIPYLSKLNSLLGVSETPVGSNLNSLLHPVLNTLTGQPPSPSEGIVGAPLHHVLPHSIHSLPTTLLKTATSPLLNLLHTRAEVRKAIRRAKLRLIPKPHLHHVHNLVGQPAPNLDIPNSGSSTFHRQPTGYIVRYVPHDKPTLPESPVVGSPHETPSDCTNNDSNTQQDIVGSTHDDDSIPQNEDTDDTDCSEE